MSSVLSRAETSSAHRCPMRMLYGLEEQRRSRNVAAFGMCGVMGLLLLTVFVLHAERTLTLPAAEMRSRFLVQAQFRTVPEKKAEQPEMQKILTEESEFVIPEEPEPVVEKKPEPVKTEPKSEPEPEVKPVSEPEQKPEVKTAPRPKPKAKPKPVSQKPVKKAAVQADVEGERAAMEPQVPSGNAAVSMPGATGREKAEKKRESEALAVLLQAVERHKRYPRQGRRSGAEGTCTLMVQIGADGRVVSCSLAEASGRTVLDAAARRLGEKLVGLDVGSSGSLRVLIPVHYRLTDR